MRLLLPPAGLAGGNALAADLRAQLGRADRLAPGTGGRRGQLLRCFDIEPQGWPLAALARQHETGDAGSWVWLRADPAFVRPDMAGARLMAQGPALALDAADVAALLPPLASLFAASGLLLDVPHPAHWYLRVPAGRTLPTFADPSDALGEDVFDHFPRDPLARPWRTLDSEAQVLLHNHPWNARRVEQGKPPINALWFWGGGALPATVRAHHALTLSDDPVCRALAAFAGRVQALPAGFVQLGEDATIDLGGLRDGAALVADWVRPAIDALRHGHLRALHLDVLDGLQLLLAPAQRWRIWRKPLPVPAW